MVVTAVVFDVGETLVSQLQDEVLYPDAVACLVELRSRGYALGLAGGEAPVAEAFLRETGVDVDLVASSQRWGLEKASAEFFDRLASEAGRPAGEIAYVGDRLDDDVLPAKRAGMVAVFLRRGPWAYVHALSPDAAQADLQIDSLAELPEALAGVGRS